MHQQHLPAQLGSGIAYVPGAILPCLIGMAGSFLAGLLALK